jgi:opacity protein-like surface antigen
MRRLLTFAVLAFALALPAGAAARERGANGANDGILSVKDARGIVTIQGRGGVIGSFAKGSVLINDPVDGDGTGPIVTGDDWSKDKSDTATVWGGTRVRFRIIGGTFRIVVRGRGINLSFVGTGSVILNGAGTDDDGSYSINGSDYNPIAAFALPFQLSAASGP